MSTAPLTADEERALREAWASIGTWERTSSTEDVPCPLCDGEGEIDCVRFDAATESPATLVGYGIGEGLEAAELVAESTGRLLATLDQARVERDVAKRALSDLAAELEGVLAGLAGPDEDFGARVPCLLESALADARAERDGAADLPAEILAPRAERDAEADERDGLSAEKLALLARVAELEAALGGVLHLVPSDDEGTDSYEAARAALKGGTP